jgi:hypothetical protein
MMRYTILITFYLFSLSALGLERNRLGLGSNQIYMGMLNKVTSQSSGKTDFLGTHHMYPITVNFQHQLNSDWYWIPTLTYSLLPRKTEGGAVEETILMLGTPFGKNVGQNWDWFFGPGLYRYSITGKGGSFTDPNGNSFYYPDGSATNQLLYLSGGMGWTYDDLRFAAEIICLGCSSNEKRTLGLSFLFSYQGWSL